MSSFYGTKEYRRINQTTAQDYLQIKVEDWK
jgi:hypothetical protein